MGPGTAVTSTVSKPDGASWHSSLLLWFYQPGRGELENMGSVPGSLFSWWQHAFQEVSTPTKHTCSLYAEPGEARYACYFTSAEVLNLKLVISIIAGRHTTQDRSANCSTAGLRSKLAAGKKGLGAASRPTHTQPSHIILWYLCICSGLEDSAQ